MNNKTTAWIAFFRLPNLPTVPGDAFAGAAIALALLAGASSSGSSILKTSEMVSLIGAGLAALFFYMFGLADNDIVGAEEDRTHAPKRPIPAGAITVLQARIARGICLALAVLTGVCCSLPFAWWSVAIVLIGLIVAYNRWKSRRAIFGLVAMGLCRGLSLYAGAAAMSSSADAKTVLLAPAVLLAVVGWTAYISAVTLLAAQEHAAERPLSVVRFLPGLTVFIPMTAFMTYPREVSWLLVGVCLLCAYGVWVISVTPLGRPHTPEVRRRAVGGAIGAIIYLQAGFMLTYPDVLFISLVFAVFISSTFIRKLFNEVSGS